MVRCEALPSATISERRTSRACGGTSPDRLPSTRRRHTGGKGATVCKTTCAFSRGLPSCQCARIAVWSGVKNLRTVESYLDQQPSLPGSTRELAYWVGARE